MVLPDFVQIRKGDNRREVRKVNRIYVDVSCRPCELCRRISEPCVEQEAGTSVEQELGISPGLVLAGAFLSFLFS